MERLKKIFRVVISSSKILTLTAAATSLVGVTLTGFYPGIIMLLLLTLVPFASDFYAEKKVAKSKAFQRNYYRTLTIINLLTMQVVLWMTFVIFVDRVFANIL